MQTMAGWTPQKLAAKYDNADMVDLLVQEKKKRKESIDQSRGRKGSGFSLSSLLCGSKKSAATMD